VALCETPGLLVNARSLIEAEAGLLWLIEFMADDNSSRKLWVSIIVALIGAAAAITVAIVNKPSAPSAPTATSIPAAKTETSVAERNTSRQEPNFAGTWQLASEDWNGFGERPRFTVTQQGRELLITGLTKATHYEIDADGKAVCRFLYAAGMTPYQSGTGEAPALVQTYTVRLAGANKLVYENTAQYNAAIGGHTVGTDRYVQRYERVSPN
jgi:hypothetical protein